MIKETHTEKDIKGQTLQIDEFEVELTRSHASLHFER